MSLVIKILAPAEGDDDLYLVDFWLDEDEQGRGKVLVTPSKEYAKQFPDFITAVEFWKQQSKRMPLRPDGKPNRPLTAFSITFEPVEEGD